MDKIVDCKKADFVEKIVSEDLNTALKIAEEIEDFEAKSLAYLNIFKFTKDDTFLERSLDNAYKCKQRDGILLLIVESVSKINRKKAEMIAEQIKREYYRDKAFATIVENCCALDLASKIVCKRVLSSSLKRLALKNNSVKIAMAIPDPYYKALALLEFAKYDSSVFDKLEDVVDSIKNECLKNRMKRKLKILTSKS